MSVEKQKYPIKLEQSLPCAATCEAWHRGNCALQTLERYTAHQETEPKTPVKVFLGLPGSGKSTLIETLQKVTGGTVYHLGAFAKEMGGGMNQAEKSSGQLLSGLDTDFLEHVAAQKPESIILDGFPRSVAQLEHLEQYATAHHWDVQFFYVELPAETGTTVSYDRQRSRAIATNTPIDEKRFQGKIARALSQDLAVIAKLGKDTRLTTLNGMDDPEQVLQSLREHTDLSFETLAWEDDVLAIAAQAERELGIPLRPGAGLFYRPFWNEKYGPSQLSMDKDVHVAEVADIPRVLAYLRAVAPQYRWSVDSRLQDTREFYGIETHDLDDAMTFFPLTFRQGSVTQTADGKHSVRCSPEVEADLRAGIIRLDENLFTQVAQADKSAFLDRAVSRAHKTLSEYPGLRLEGIISAAYQQKYGEHLVRDANAHEWDQVQQSVQQAEKGGKAQWYGEWSDEQRLLGKAVHHFFDVAPKKSLPVPRPIPTSLPGALEDVRNGTTEWDSAEGLLQYALNHSKNDEEFVEFFLNQVRSRSPVGGKDPTIQEVLFFKPFGGKNISSGPVKQKETHNGWLLDMHLKESVYCLDTAFLDQIDTLSEDEKMTIRSGMRLALLYHDVGKLYNTNTPGGHESVGAKLFLKHRPAWISDKVAAIAAFCIKHHDALGRLSRGIMEKIDAEGAFDPAGKPAYKGALSPAALLTELAKPVTAVTRQEGKAEVVQYPLTLSAAEKIAIITAIWEADVGSVASLRWILPVAPTLAKMVSLEADKEHTPS